MRPLLLFVLAAAIATAAEPIRLHPANPHYFAFRGKPTVLITSAEHYGAVLNKDFDYRRYLKTLAADRLNLTRVFVGSYREGPQAFNITENTWRRRIVASLRRGRARTCPVLLMV